MKHLKKTVSNVLQLMLSRTVLYRIFTLFFMFKLNTKFRCLYPLEKMLTQNPNI